MKGKPNRFIVVSAAAGAIFGGGVSLALRGMIKTPASTATSVSFVLATDAGTALPTQRDPFATQTGRGSKDGEQTAAQDFQRLTKRHAEQPVDPSWAPQTEQELRSNYESICRLRGIKLISIECRTNSCAITLEWPSYRIAGTNYREIALHHPGALNCATEIVLPSPWKVDGGYRSTLFLTRCKKETDSSPT